jgi:hypothetical protein
MCGSSIEIYRKKVKTIEIGISLGFKNKYKLQTHALTISLIHLKVIKNIKNFEKKLKYYTIKKISFSYFGLIGIFEKNFT